MLWLKRCVMPSLTKEAIAIDVVYPAVHLPYDRSLGLLLLMVCSLLNGLREFHTKVNKVELSLVMKGAEYIRLQTLKLNYYTYI